MYLTRVTLSVRQLDPVADFYAAVLGLPLVRQAESIMVRIGATELRITEDPAAVGDHHLAFLIPTGRFAEAKEWLNSRTPLLSRDGVNEFEMPAAWNAQSLYFAGPDRSVLELIMRRDLPPTRSGPFGSDDLLAISEVGVAVPDVPATAGHLRQQGGFEAYGLPVTETFTPVGGIDGLLILVESGRLWHPTEECRAEQQPILVEATGGRPGRYPLGDRAWLTVPD